MTRGLAVWLSAALATSVACGTTVTGALQNPVGNVAGDSGNGSGLAAPVSQGSTRTDTSTGAAVSLGPTAGGGSTHASGPTGTVAVAPVGGSAGGSTTTRPEDGPGVTATTIQIGISYYQSAESANEALGARGLNTGDPVAGTRLLIHDINSTGGVAGRRLVPLFYAIDPQSSTPYAIEAQAECSYFTQDHKVFALIDGTPAVDSRVCLAQHGVAFLGGPLITPDLTVNEVDAYAALLTRVFAAQVSALASHGWFTGWNRQLGQPSPTRGKVGVVTSGDTWNLRAVDDVLLPALRQTGYPVNPGDRIEITPPGGFSDDGATVAAIDNAALKLNADGVDHVILNDNNGSLTLLFNNYAYSQGYFPRYGGNTADAWEVLLSGHDLQAKTLAGAMGIGWQPLFDLPYQAGDGPDSNPARHRCLSLFARNGMPASSDSTAGGDAEGCDVMFLLPAALRGYSGPLNLASFLHRVDALGDSYPLASGLGSSFGSGKHDGAGGYSFLAFQSSCQCVTYQGPVQPLPG